MRISLPFEVKLPNRPIGVAAEAQQADHSGLAAAVVAAAAHVAVAQGSLPQAVGPAGIDPH